MCDKITFENELTHPDRTIPYHDLVYVLTGGFNVIVENELIESREGDIMFLPAFKHHYPNADNLENSACYYIHFSYDEKDYISFEKAGISDKFYSIPSKINITNNPNLITYFHEIITLSTLTSKEENKLLHSILSRILAEIDLITHLQNRFQYSELTSNIINTLSNNVNKKISINELALEFKFAPRTIQKNFKKETGLSIHEYHLQLKLNKSKFFLAAYPNMSLKEIAHMFAFYDEFHYSKSFKKLFGFSPRQYKKQ